MSQAVVRKIDVGQITAMSDAEFLDMVLSIQSTDQARQLIDEMDEIEQLVCNIKRLEHLTNKVERMRDTMYVEIYRKGPRYYKVLQEVNRSLPKACAWYLSLSDEQAAELVPMGTSLLSAYRHNVTSPEQRASREATARRAPDRVRAAIMRDYKENGEVSIARDSVMGRFKYGAERDNLSKFFMDCYVDGLRNDLLRSDAVSIGNGTYVSKENKDRLQAAIDIRVESIAHDLRSLMELVITLSDSGFGVQDVVIDKCSNMNPQLTSFSAVWIALFFSYGRQLMGRVKWRFATKYVLEKSFLGVAKLIAEGETNFWKVSS